jgi:hypothetical protein
MSKIMRLIPGTMLALLLSGLLFTVAQAQQVTPTSPQVVPSNSTMGGMMATQPVPAGSANDPQTGTMSMGSGMNGMGSMTGTGSMGAMSGTGSMSSSCPAMGSMSGGMSSTGMGQMGSGTAMGSGMNGAGMSQGNMMTGMNGSITMNGSAMNPSASLFDADGRLVFWNLNPWWLLGWMLFGLLVLAILGGAAYGVVALVRNTRRPNLTGTTLS